MRLQEALWSAEEAQWRTLGIIRGRVGGDTVLLFRMPARPDREGGGYTPAVAEAEAKREVGANSKEVK